jgi:hypothetical protein
MDDGGVEKDSSVQARNDTLTSIFSGPGLRTSNGATCSAEVFLAKDNLPLALILISCIQQSSYVLLLISGWSKSGDKGTSKNSRPLGLP